MNLLGVSSIVLYHNARQIVYNDRQRYIYLYVLQNCISIYKFCLFCLLFVGCLFFYVVLFGLFFLYVLNHILFIVVKTTMATERDCVRKNV